MSAPKVKIDTEAVKKAMQEAMVEGMNVSFLGLGRLVRGKLSQKGTGRFYRVARGSKSGRNLRAQGYHQASAPGFPPAVNTNRLRASFISDQLGTWKYGYAFIRTSAVRTILNYGSRVFYAPMLEFGTRKMRPRPFLRPSVKAFATVVERIFATAVARKFKPRTP
jgi:HK97 gp10 family phage protein